MVRALAVQLGRRYFVNARRARIKAAVLKVIEVK